MSAIQKRNAQIVPREGLRSPPTPLRYRRELIYIYIGSETSLNANVHFNGKSGTARTKLKPARRARSTERAEVADSPRKRKYAPAAERLTG
ncbi:hypothetical protein EVAR_5857_1 [Eumeta japonica]|uniref:Uncharacterized protein n=1 Tax=Eumeta variegata TaxID=151549 RepID=A0A4C1TD00_EUMVA|nr:hypothetical protein EVAR_5857_1 [Eumeta japonica]